MGKDIAAAVARAFLEPAVDDLQRDIVVVQCLGIGDAVGNPAPRPQVVHRDDIGLGRLTDQLGDRKIGPGIAEIGFCETFLARLPPAEISVDQPGEYRRIAITGDCYDSVVGAVPAAMKARQPVRRGGIEALFGTDRHTLGKQLPGKDMLVNRIADAGLWSGVFAQLGQYDAALAVDRPGVEIGRFDHCRERLHRLFKPGRGRAGQIKLIDRGGRGGAGVGIATEGRAQALPDTLGVAIAEQARTAKAEMFEKMRIAALRFALHQRAGGDPHPDRHLPRRRTVVAHGIAQPIGKRSELPSRVTRNVAAGVEPIAFCERWGNGE